MNSLLCPTTVPGSGSPMRRNREPFAGTVPGTPWERLGTAWGKAIRSPIVRAGLASTREAEVLKCAE